MARMRYSETNGQRKRCLDTQRYTDKERCDREKDGVRKTEMGKAVVFRMRTTKRQKIYRDFYT